MEEWYTGFWITGNRGNNVFGFDTSSLNSLISEPAGQIDKERGNNIYVAPRIKGALSDLALGSNPVFREKNQEGVIVEYQGLEHFVELQLSFKKNISTSFHHGGLRGRASQGDVTQSEAKSLDSSVNTSEGHNCIIFDNHNHALFFWYEAYRKHYVPKGVKVIHIDQHTDMNSNMNTLSDIDELTSQEVFDFTQYSCNVGNFIQPALQSGLISGVELITTEYKLLHLDTSDNVLEQEEYILDIDLDFWHPDMSIEYFDKTIEQVRKLLYHAKYITIATSPYFLDQELALILCKKICV